MVEHNVCSNQLDALSGCFGARGDENTFRYGQEFPGYWGYVTGTLG